jgi:hypothetical protein
LCTTLSTKSRYIQEKYTASANGGKKYDLAEASKVGNYNVLMESTDKSLWNSAEETFESSHHAFRDAFPDGFPWGECKS